MLKLPLFLNSSLIKKKLEIAHFLDQKLRLLFVKYDKLDRNNFKMLKFILSVIIHFCDKINRKILVSVINCYGWPSYKIYGVKANEAAFYILQHSNIAFLEKYICFLKDSVCSQDSFKYHLATAQDRLLMKRNKKQIYGTQINTNKLSKEKNIKDSIWPIVNPIKVNERRKKVGILITIDDYKDKKIY